MKYYIFAAIAVFLIVLAALYLKFSGQQDDSFHGRLGIIAAELVQNPAQTNALMVEATQSCASEKDGIPYDNRTLDDHLIGIMVDFVQIVAQNIHLESEEYLANIRLQLGAKEQVLDKWLVTLSVAEKTTAVDIMKFWMGDPDMLVACHRHWLAEI
ncbi:MAG: hypothetical protein V3V13_06220 [Paracoccaceae bacterium]